MLKLKLNNYNITNLDNKILILLLSKYLFQYKLLKNNILKIKSHLIKKFKKIICHLNYKHYND